MIGPVTLIISSGSSRTEKRLEESQLDSYTIGRGTDATLFLNNPSISRKHCRIYIADGAVLIEDIGSSSGTWLNSQRLSAPAHLADGDEVQIGDASIEVHLGSERATAAAEATIVSNIAKPQTEAPQLHCANCGRLINSFPCATCGATRNVQHIARAPRAEPRPVPPRTDAGFDGRAFPEPGSPRFLQLLKQLLKLPTTCAGLSLWIIFLWICTCTLLFIISHFSTPLYYLSVLLFVLSTGSAAREVLLAIFAPQRVLRLKNIELLWGFVRLVAWDPVEGVLFLKNKALGFFDDDLYDGHGGVQLIYPFLGDELTLRVPLEVQTLQFFLQGVVTRESLAVNVRGTVKWQIKNIRNFYLLLSRELRNTSSYCFKINSCSRPFRKG